MIRKVFVPIRGDGKSLAVLRHAIAVSRRFNAHIQAAHCRPRPEDLLPFGVPIPAFLHEQLKEQSTSVADAEEAKLRADFDALLRSEGLVETPIGDVSVDENRPTISWTEALGKQVDAIKTMGRLCDLVVVAKPDRDRNLGANTLRAALFNTPAPVLMAPPKDPPTASFGERIAIAWNGSLEAARAVAMTLPMIERATAVTVLTIGPGERHGASIDDLTTYLAIRGVKVEVKASESSARPGDALLEQAQAANADLLIMGAYGHSRERETVFGGATQQVVDHAMQPVILVH